MRHLLHHLLLTFSAASVLLVAAVVAPVTPALAAAPQAPPSWEDTLDRVASAVVAIKVRATRDFDTERARGSTGTGFVIDKENGLILTNRHMVHEGPVIAEAVFLNHEEVDLEPIYRDPVHDFGFYRFDPDDVRYMDLVELPLDPGAARVGLDIRVVGNDSGEKISILDGTLARLDRAAPTYGRNTYNDFNTFYLQAASNTSGGSSGSPVVDVFGRVVGLNAGSRTSTASAFYLPLDRVVRAVPYMLRGQVPPRGTLQTTFEYTPYDEVRRLGLQEATETAAREAYPDAIGMLVVDRLVPGGPADGVLRPGDVVVSLNGEPLADFVTLEAAMDDAVGDTLTLGVERGGEPLDLELTVGDLHAITPSSYLEVGRGIFHTTSYMQARNHNIPVQGVYVAQAGYAFGRGGLDERTIISHVDGQPVPDLDAFQAELEAKGHGERVRLRVWPISDPQRESELIVTMDRRWHSMKRCTLQPTTGAWPCERAAEPPARARPEPGTVVFPEADSRGGRTVAHGLVQVDFDMPYPTAGVKAANYRGVGIVIDAEQGLVLADRDTVPVRIGDIELTFAGQLRVPGRVRYLHPVHNLVVLQYDPELLGEYDVQAVSFQEREVQVGDQVWQVGLDSNGGLVEYPTSVAWTGALYLGASRTPRFRDVNVEGFTLTDSLPTIGGVITDKRGRVVAAWLSFMDQARGEARFRALPSVFVNRLVEPLQAGEPVAYRALGAEFGTVGLAEARERGLTQARADQILDHDPEHRKVLEVDRVWGATPAQGLLRNGDLLLQVDGRTVSQMHELEALTRAESLDVVVLRDGEEVELTVPTVLLDGEGVDELVQWAGLIVHAPHREVASQSGEARDGVYGAWIWYGTPAYDASVRPTRHIVEIDGQPVQDLDDFLQIVSDQRDRQPVRVTLEQLDGRVEVRTMKLDHQFWPTTVIRWSDEGWTREEIGADAESGTTPAE